MPGFNCLGPAEIRSDGVDSVAGEIRLCSVATGEATAWHFHPSIEGLLNAKGRGYRALCSTREVSNCSHLQGQTLERLAILGS